MDVDIFSTLQPNKMNGFARSGPTLPMMNLLRRPLPTTSDSSFRLVDNLPASTCPQTTTDKCSLLMVEIKGCVCSNDFEKEKSESYWWTSARIKGKGACGWRGFRCRGERSCRIQWLAGSYRLLKFHLSWSLRRSKIHPGNSEKCGFSFFSLF